MNRSLNLLGSILVMLMVLGGCSREETPAPATDAAAKPAAQLQPTPLARAPIATDEADDPDYPEDLEELYVDLEAEPDEGAPPLTVNWTSTVEDGTEPYTYLWDFGDGSPTSTEATPTHVYKSEGDYTAVLKVKDAKGLWGTEEYDVYVEKDEE